MAQDPNTASQRSFRSVTIKKDVLRSSYIDHLESTLASSKLTLDDFDLVIDQISRRKSTDGFAMVSTIGAETIHGGRVKITCNFHEQFYLIIDIYQNAFEVRSVPGKILVADHFEVNSWNSALEVVSDWVDRVYFETIRHPIARMIVELDEEMEGILKHINQLPNEYFTKEEGENLIDRLNELESRFKTYFEQLEEENTDVKTQVRELTKDMEFLRAAVFSVTQKKWSRIFANRLGRLLNSPAGQAVLSSGVSTVIKGLLEGPK